MTIFTNNEQETVSAGKSFGETLRPNSVAALSGGLGAGKTAFVRGIAAALGIDSIITSPTFTIVNEYDGNIPLFHFDVYRLSASDELYDIGWDDYLSRGGICAVEWSDIIKDALPNDTIFIEITAINEHTRKIVVSSEGENTNAYTGS